MEEIKILIVALVSFLSQENLPIAAKSAEVHIDRTNRQVTIKQYDLVSVEQYRELAKAGLDSLMQARNLIEDMGPLRLTHTSFYEEEDKLNATLYLQYDELKDLRKMSFYADAEDNLSYPYMDSFTYDLQTGRIDGRHVRFDQGQDVKFKMESKQELPDVTYSLLDDWKALIASNYIDVTNEISVKQFKNLRAFILKKGAGRSFRNIENNNPYYQFSEYGAYLASSTKFLDHSNRLPVTDYDNLILWGDGQYNLYLFDEHSNNTNPYLKKERVYVLKPNHLNKDTLSKYLKEVLKRI